ncbi:MAG: response regulator, partial [Gemmatimonadaceae bacterium]|nr:response regulator [Gemmatimonadaceae bacterium]
AALLAAAAVLALWLAATMRSALARGGKGGAEAVAVVDSAPHAVLVVDALGRVTRANAKAALLLDASVLGLVGSSIEKWLRAGAPMKQERVGAWLESAARGGVARRADGRELPVELRVGQGELSGEPLFVIVLMDRSEQPDAKQQVQAAKDDAARARQRQSDLVQAMHQEIRTPMSRVMGMAHLLKDSQLSGVQQGYVDSLMRSAQTMMTFVTDVLDLAKAEQGTLQLVEAPFEVRGLLEEVGTRCGPQAEANRVRLETRVTERTPLRVMGDASRLKQVLITIVGNGIRFAADGRVSLTADGEPNGHQVRLHLTVTDTGPGMDAETTRRLLAPDPTTVSKLAGGGLGLAMAKHLVELMGGKLRVTSLQGEGSTFACTLVLRAAERQPEVAGAVPAKLAGARALVVDGSPADAQATREWMRSWGMRVETSATAEEAIGALKRAAAEGDPVEIALVDRQTLGETADAFARRLRADAAIAGVGLLVATPPEAPVGEAQQLAHAGCDAVLAKPLGAAVLSRTLAAVADKPRHERGNGVLVAHGGEAHAPRRPIEHANGHIPVIEEASVPRRAAPAATDTRVRVLLAEDNRVNQIVATNLLQRLGCRVEVVSDGAEAVKAASRHEFDVVLMDIIMPNLDGLAATQLIRRLPAPFHGPHIIAMGTSASPDERDRYLAAGMNDVIPKPLTPEAVQAALERRPAGLDRRRTPVDEAVAVH